MGSFKDLKYQNQLSQRHSPQLLPTAKGPGPKTLLIAQLDFIQLHLSAAAARAGKTLYQINVQSLIGSRSQLAPR